MLKLFKSGIFVNTVATVLFVCVCEITSRELHKDKYMETFHYRLHKLLQSQNITEYAIVGKIKRECEGCATTKIFWSGTIENSKVPTTDQDEIGAIVYKYILATSRPSSLTHNSPKMTHSETTDKNNEILMPALVTQSEREELSYSTEETRTEKIIPTEKFHSPTEQPLPAPLHDVHFNKERYLQAEICPNGTENQMQNGGTLKFEYMLLSAAFLYITVVTLVYMTVFCSRRTKGYQSGIGSGSLSGSGSDVV